MIQQTQPSIIQKLTRQEVKNIVRFLSYHLGYVPSTVPQVVFAKTASQYAKLLGEYVRTKGDYEDYIDESNKGARAFYAHHSNTIVFQGFSYVEGEEIPQFIIPLSTIIHEFIHFFQYATGPYGSYSILYEGTNEILSCFLGNEYKVDYEKEAVIAFNLVMELSGHDFWEAINWMRKYTLHSDKNGFTHRSIKTHPTFSKYKPAKLMKLLEKGDLDQIENEEVRSVFTKYSLTKIKQICAANRQIVQF